MKNNNNIIQGKSFLSLKKQEIEINNNNIWGKSFLSLKEKKRKMKII